MWSTSVKKKDLSMTVAKIMRKSNNLLYNVSALEN